MAAIDAMMGAPAASRNRLELELGRPGRKLSLSTKVLFFTLVVDDDTVYGAQVDELKAAIDFADLTVTVRHKAVLDHDVAVGRGADDDAVF